MVAKGARIVSNPHPLHEGLPRRRHLERVRSEDVVDRINDLNAHPDLLFSSARALDADHDVEPPSGLEIDDTCR